MTAEARALLSPSRPLLFPLLVDRTGGDATVISESKQIVLHLWEAYSTDPDKSQRCREWVERTCKKADVVRPLVPGGVDTRMKNLVNLLADEDLISHMLASVFRPRGAFMARGEGGGDEEELRLWGREGCAYSRIVREELCVRQLAYTAHVCGEGEVARLGCGGREVEIGSLSGLSSALTLLRGLK